MREGLVIGHNNMKLEIILGEDEWPGVLRIAGIVAEDISLLTELDAPEVTKLGAAFQEAETAGPGADAAGNPSDGQQDFPIAPGRIYVGTCGHSALADKLIECGYADASRVAGLKECYSFQIKKAGDGYSLFILGSDKRGTIYGLFHISELLGVSPWVWFADVLPEHKDNVTITPDMSFVSKEPSVEYRGIFINDEWPSFGNWTFEHFGGFTAEMYEHVFELILRLKGNYLWPAMWTSSFSLDGPGMDSAILADEMGIVMSNSHHEPCLRHSEEWDMVKGEDTPYGTEWNFDKNREGLTNYWRDGLIRNGHLENIITMGMRGERDSEVLGRSATLQENIDYIKDVVTVQNDLISRNINEDLSLVPRMIAIYKEVEQYYYGDEATAGLKDWEGLNGITCMLCEDNHGNMRGLPLENERDRDGGYGMYYHFDYHGGPVSYEWVNSTPISKTWEQMCQAYESGVKKIWIVNTGDLKPQELPISFFLDLAYDYDKWGISNPDSSGEYLDMWVRQQFGQMDMPTGYEDLSAETDIPGAMIETGETVIDAIKELLEGYTYVNGIRRPETMNAEVYHPFNYAEADRMLYKAATLYNKAAYLSTCIFEETPLYDAYEELVGFPVRASCNLLYMWLCSGKNAALASKGRPSANIYNTYVDECMFRDEILTDLYHSLADGKWNGMMRSEHIGFTNWNDEEAMYPVLHSVFPSHKPRMLVYPEHRDRCTAGGDWTRKPLVITGLLDPSENIAFIVIENAGQEELEWKAECDREYIRLTPETSVVSPYEPREEDPEMGVLRPFPSELVKNTGLLAIELDRSAMGLAPGESEIATVTVSSEFGHVDVLIPLCNYESVSSRHFVPLIPGELMQKAHDDRLILEEYRCNELGLIMDAEDYDSAKSSGEGEYRVIPRYGKYHSGIKAYPVTMHFDIDKAASVTYDIMVPSETDLDITLITAPSNPVDGSRHLNLGVGINAETPIILSMVETDYMGGENSCPQWCKSVLDQEHRKSVTLHAMEGLNHLSIYAVDPGVVLERILIRASGTRWSEGYIMR